MKNYYLKTGIHAGLLIPLVIPFTQCKTDDIDKKPNIVLILADDLGWADVGYNGSEIYETPNLDRLAEEGIILSRFYPSAANSAPSRASLLTGMYSPRHSVYIPQGYSRGGDVADMRFKVPTIGQDSTFFNFHVSNNQLAPEFESLAEMLKRAGYISGRFGKWHIGDDNQGFDTITANGVPGYITNVNGLEERFYDDTTVNEKLTDAAIEFMESNKKKPFFLYLSHWEVHTPMAAHVDRIRYYEKKLERINQREIDPVYAAEVEQLDISLGRIMKKLEELGMKNNTLLIFTSDNGGLMEETSNFPLRAGKGTFYEGGIRTPFVARWPAVIRPGSKTDYPVSGIDLMPTLAEIVGVDKPKDQPVDGISVLPLLKGGMLAEPRTLFFHFPLYLGGTDGVSNVLPVYKSNRYVWRAVPSTTLIQGTWKLIYYYEYDSYELYNLEQDISEQNDLSLKEKETANVLLEKLFNWCQEVNAPIPNVPNDRFNSLK